MPKRKATIIREQVPHPRPRYRYTLVVNGVEVDQRVSAHSQAPIAMRKRRAELNGQPMPRDNRGGHNKLDEINLWPLFDELRQK